ncbi:hypothetical protein [Hominenteromicrobium sp.]
MGSAVWLEQQATSNLGQLTTKEILDAIGELDFDPEHIEKF